MVLHFREVARGNAVPAGKQRPTDVSPPNEPGFVPVGKGKTPGTVPEGKGKESILCEAREDGRKRWGEGEGTSGRSEQDRARRIARRGRREDRARRGSPPGSRASFGEGQSFLFGGWAVPLGIDRGVGHFGSAAPPRVTCDTSTCEAARCCISFVSVRTKKNAAMECRRAKVDVFASRKRLHFEGMADGNSLPSTFGRPVRLSISFHGHLNRTCVVGRFASTHLRQNERERVTRHGRSPTSITATHTPGTFRCRIHGPPVCLGRMRFDRPGIVDAVASHVVVSRTASVHLRTCTVGFHGYVSCATTSSSATVRRIVLLRTTTFSFCPPP